MATLVFTALGSVLGGPLFAAAGALAGSAIDQALIGSPTSQGARLNQLAATTSSYGDALPRHFGRMRVAGTVIWATDLVEHSQTSGGKGKPKVTTFSYSCSFAVALGSRPIASIGRIWADGNLLRGTDGDLKVGGTLRFHSGEGDQAVDPLIAAAEGSGSCPGWRGIAYVMFEDLQLSEYGNRIPSLTFEIFADDGPLNLAQVLSGVIDNVDAQVPLDGVIGLTLDAMPAQTLTTLMPVFPVYCDASGGTLVIAPELSQTQRVAIGEAATSVGHGDFGGRAGYIRHRAAMNDNPPRVLRYYDVDRDYQPGLQRAGGRPLPGQPRALDLPVALVASDAQRLIARAASADGWARETMQWRTTELDPSIAPGVLVSVSGQPGTWRVLIWEWRDTGVELSLERATPLDVINGLANGGRASLAADLASGATDLVVFELPWDGIGSGDSSLLYAAVSSASVGWTGAELSADHGDGALVPLGTSGRLRCKIGSTVDALGIGSPSLIDRANSVTVAMLSADMALTDATMRQLAAGSNRALIGREIIQFATAVSLGGGQWRLENLLRGRGGTEHLIDSHIVGERFVLLDDRPVTLDPTIIGDALGTVVAAIGLADAHAVEAPIVNRGIGLRPLAPCHPVVRQEDGGIAMDWTRRARGAWNWLDGVDTPLHEQAEAYEVTYGQGSSVAGRWAVASTSLTLDSGQVAALRTALPAGSFSVRQRGTYALSPALLLTAFA